jgi:hypothetical protein
LIENTSSFKNSLLEVCEDVEDDEQNDNNFQHCNARNEAADGAVSSSIVLKRSRRFSVRFRFHDTQTKDKAQQPLLVRNEEDLSLQLNELLSFRRGQLETLFSFTCRQGSERKNYLGKYQIVCNEGD